MAIGFTGRIYIWNTETGNLLSTLEPTDMHFSHSFPANALTVSPDGKTILSAHLDDILRIWNPDTSKEIRKIQGNGGNMWAIAVSPGGGTMATLSDMEKGETHKRNREIRFFDTKMDEPSSKFPMQDEKDAYAISFVTDDIIAVGCRDGVARFWQISRTQFNADFKVGRGAIYAIESRKSMIAAASEDGTVTVWRYAKENP